MVVVMLVFAVLLAPFRRVDRRAELRAARIRLEADRRQARIDALRRMP